MQVKFDKAGCKPFFKKHRQQAKLEAKISQAVNSELTNGMTKVKLATHIRINQQPCYEFRLNLGTIGSARIAFYSTTRFAEVLFISTDLQKSTFTAELTQFLQNRH